MSANTYKEILQLLSQISDKALNLQKKVDSSTIAQRLVPVSEVSSIIQKEKANQNLTIQQIADLAEVSTSSVNKLAAGNLSVNVIVLRKVLQALGYELWLG